MNHLQRFYSFIPIYECHPTQMIRASSLRPLLLLFVFCLSALFLFTIIREPLHPETSEGCQQDSVQQQDSGTDEKNSPNRTVGQRFQAVECLIDGRTRIPCIQKAGQPSEVFLPFNGFLKRQFDLYGQFGQTGVFEYYTSDVKVRMSDGQEHSKADSIPSWLAQFSNVAQRQRVKCLNPENGLPMSVQWAPVPYFYPVQILQFGLEHFVKNQSLTGQSPIIRWLANNKRQTRSDANLLRLERGESEQFRLDSRLPFLLFSWRPTALDGGHFEVEFESQISKSVLKLEFRQSSRNDCVWKADEIEGRGQQDELNFVYGLSGKLGNFTEFLLDTAVFAEKALALLANGTRNRQRTIHEFVPTILRFFGSSELALNSIRQQSNAHQENFMRVADWLLESQDEKGGWAVPVQRTFDIDQGQYRLVLAPGWHSAMAQGHALSFLSRAFNATGDNRFLEAGQKAIAIFNMPASDGGVLNRLFGHDWFEEYPTTAPGGTFVLNGLIYALIGLHDFSWHNNRSIALFRRGLASLRALLPLFDNGQRSVYDLRHVQLASRPNIARWDYHALHVRLLDYLHSVTAEPLFQQMATRWAEYAHGMALKPN